LLYLDTMAVGTPWENVNTLKMRQNFKQNFTKYSVGMYWFV